MKQVLLMMICLACININYGQVITENNGDTAENRIFTKVEVEAEFPGGTAGWRDFLVKNLRADAPVNNGARRGRYMVILRFVVSKDGTLSDIRCESDPGYGTCQEAIRTIKKSPKWSPATQNGKAVNAYRRQPITYLVE